MALTFGNLVKIQATHNKQSIFFLIFFYCFQPQKIFILFRLILHVNIWRSEFVADCIFAPHSSLDGVDHLFRLFHPNHLPLLYTSFHPQIYTINHEYWPLPPSTRNEWLIVRRALCFLRSRFETSSSPFHHAPLIHGRRLLSFSMTNFC